MKKVFTGIIGLLLFSVIGGFIYGKTAPRVPPSPPTTIQRPTQLPSPDITAVQKIDQPILLEVPKIAIKANVESVGLDQKKNMDVPKLAQNVGWYNLGVKPGEKGNSVMAGHFDTATGQPAVFYNLSKLTIGDKIIAKDDSGTQYTYRVTDKKTYPTELFPLQEVFGQTEKYRLNLITCTGQFDNSAKNYSHRTVIYSELVQ